MGILLATELILHGKRHNTHQSSQQNPRHDHNLLTISIHIMQESLQTTSCNSHYTLNLGNYKMTMQGFLKKCFFSVLAILPVEAPVRRANWRLQGRRLQTPWWDG